MTFPFDSDILDSPWPRKGDQLFKSDCEDWRHNARLNIHTCFGIFDDDWVLYVAGYKLAGDLLVDNIEKPGQINQDVLIYAPGERYQDVLVYPIVFLYRHYIELFLKRFIKEGIRLLNISEDVKIDHNINKLWKKCRHILEKVSPEGPVEDLDAIEESIHQFSKKDPSSFSFRYPKDKKGNPLLSPDLKYINLKNLKDVMARISGFFDGIDALLSEYSDWKHEGL